MNYMVEIAIILGTITLNIISNLIYDLFKKITKKQ